MEDANRNSQTKQSKWCAPYTSLASNIHCMVKKHEDKLDRDLAAMPTSRPAFRYKQACYEAAHTRRSLAAWEIDQAERYSSLLHSLYAENKQLPDDEMESLRQALSVRSREGLEDDTDYFQAVHDDELETIQLFTAQIQQISKLLGSRGQAPETAAVPGETAEAYTVDDSDESGRATPRPRTPHGVG
jgi:hypothetical protein